MEKSDSLVFSPSSCICVRCLAGFLFTGSKNMGGHGVRLQTTAIDVLYIMAQRRAACGGERRGPRACRVAAWSPSARALRTMSPGRCWQFTGRLRHQRQPGLGLGPGSGRCSGHGVVRCTFATGRLHRPRNLHQQLRLRLRDQLGKWRLSVEDLRSGSVATPRRVFWARGLARFWRRLSSAD